MSRLTAIKKALHEHKDAAHAIHALRYFKTGPGEYAASDIFIGVRVPQIRQVARQFPTLGLEDLRALLCSPIHEERHLALVLLILQVQKKNGLDKNVAFAFYKKHIDYVNNWDLIDLSAPLLVGGYLYHHKAIADQLLLELASSSNLWHRRIAMVATSYFIRQGSYAATIRIATLLRKDPEDLLHKAVGWMLREVANRDLATTKRFLDAYAHTLPRTMLRYAIEKFSAQDKHYYMQKKS